MGNKRTSTGIISIVTRSIQSMVCVWIFCWRMYDVTFDPSRMSFPNDYYHKYTFALQNCVKMHVGHVIVCDKRILWYARMRQLNSEQRNFEEKQIPVTRVHMIYIGYNKTHMCLIYRHLVLDAVLCWPILSHLFSHSHISFVCSRMNFRSICTTATTAAPAHKTPTEQHHTNYVVYSCTQISSKAAMPNKMPTHTHQCLLAHRQTNHSIQLVKWGDQQQQHQQR